MVQREGLVDKLHVSADGTGQVGHAGSALVAGTADRVGLTRALSEAMAPTRQRRSAHDPGVVLRDLAVMLADGGDCLADLGAQRDQGELFGRYCMFRGWFEGSKRVASPSGYASSAALVVGGGSRVAVAICRAFRGA